MRSTRCKSYLLLSGAIASWVGCAEAPTTAPSPDAGPPVELGACDLHNDCGDGDGRPNRRSELAGIWDPQGQRMVIFGGTDAIPVNCGFPTPSFLDETWSFSPRCGVWKQLQGSMPSPRGRHMMAYDARGHRALLFGGRFRAGSGSYTNYNDLWQLDLATDTWSELATTSAPTARVNAAFVVDDAGEKAYLFGGNTSPSGLAYAPQNDLWELDLATQTWSSLSADGVSPSPRLFHTGLFDANRKRIVVFGGGDETAFENTAQYFNDVWAFDIAASSWTRLHDGSGTAPSRRFWGEWAYDADDDAYLLFGGHDDGNLGNTNDLWAFDPNALSWQQMREGDMWNKPANGFCDFPADFTILDQESPERRNAHVVVYASGNDCPGIITALGKTDCGAADDVFRWNLAEGKWQQLLRAREGEMCLRTEPEFDCFDMCF